MSGAVSFLCSQPAVHLSQCCAPHLGYSLSHAMLDGQREAWVNHEVCVEAGPSSPVCFIHVRCSTCVHAADLPLPLSAVPCMACHKPPSQFDPSPLTRNPSHVKCCVPEQYLQPSCNQLSRIAVCQGTCQAATRSLIWFLRGLDNNMFEV